MAHAGSSAIAELWNNVKASFGRLLDVSAASTTVDVKLNTNAGATLSTATLPAAATDKAGVMTAADKSKLEGIEANANKTVVDSAVTEGGVNPVSGAAVHSAIAEAIAGIAKLSLAVVEELPDEGEELTIYLVPATDGTDGDERDEFIYVDDEWEKIGSSRVDLSGYALLTDIPGEMTADEVAAICTL